jgi:hypothetical protein
MDTQTYFDSGDVCFTSRDVRSSVIQTPNTGKGDDQNEEVSEDVAEHNEEDEESSDIGKYDIPVTPKYSLPSSKLSTLSSSKTTTTTTTTSSSSSSSSTTTTTKSSNSAPSLLKPISGSSTGNAPAVPAVPAKPLALSKRYDIPSQDIDEDDDEFDFGGKSPAPKISQQPVKKPESQPVTQPASQQKFSLLNLSSKNTKPQTITNTTSTTTVTQTSTTSDSQTSVKNSSNSAPVVDPGKTSTKSTVNSPEKSLPKKPVLSLKDLYMQQQKAKKEQAKLEQQKKQLAQKPDQKQDNNSLQTQLSQPSQQKQNNLQDQQNQTKTLPQIPPVPSIPTNLSQQPGPVKSVITLELTDESAEENSKKDEMSDEPEIQEILASVSREYDDGQNHDVDQTAEWQPSSPSSIIGVLSKIQQQPVVQPQNVEPVKKANPGQFLFQNLMDIDDDDPLILEIDDGFDDFFSSASKKLGVAVNLAQPKPSDSQPVSEPLKQTVSDVPEVPEDDNFVKPEKIAKGTLQLSQTKSSEDPQTLKNAQNSIATKPLLPTLLAPKLKPPPLGLAKLSGGKTAGITSTAPATSATVSTTDATSTNKTSDKNTTSDVKIIPKLIPNNSLKGNVNTVNTKTQTSISALSSSTTPSTTTTPSAPPSITPSAPSVQDLGAQSDPVGNDLLNLSFVTPKKKV